MNIPMHPDFRKIYNDFIKRYGKERGKEYYYRWLNKNKLDDTKPMPKHRKGGIEDMDNILNLNDMTKPFIASFSTVISDIKVDATEHKRVIISGILMNSSYNQNYFRVANLNGIAGEVDGTPIKVQHAYSDWDVIGTGLNGNQENDIILYSGEIVDPKAVEKFETKAWNAKNMGVSPSVSFEKAICTICSKDIRECDHITGVEYNGKTCRVDLYGAHIQEFSMTSRPAYGPDAGTIDDVTFSASIEKNIRRIDNMKEIKEFEAALKKKEAEVTELKAEVEKLKKVTKDAEIEKKDAEIAELKAKIKKAEEETPPEDTPPKDKEPEGEEEGGEDKEDKPNTEAMKKELDATKEKLATYVKAERTAKIKERISDETIIAEIVDKNMTDKEFEAELKKIDTLKEQIKNNEGVGATAGDKGNKTAEEEFVNAWGASKEDILKDITNGGAGE